MNAKRANDFPAFLVGPLFFLSCPVLPILASTPLNVATAGDVNGDGFSDLVVGAPLDDSAQTDAGRVFIYRGSPVGIATIPTWILEGEQAGAELGHSVATAGDINGDGFSDVIIAAWKHTAGGTGAGRVFVYHGSPTGLSNTPAWIRDGAHQGANFGGCVAPAGDVNGDGFADVIIGTPGYDNGQDDAGRAEVYLGSPAGLGPTPNWTAEGGLPSEHFGTAVATAGDVNGDGFADILVGSPGYSNGQAGEGRALVYLGSSTGIEATPAWSAEGGQVDGRFGESVSTAGDMNGDGYADVVVGAPSFDGDQADEGGLFLFHGSASGLSAGANWTADGEQSGAFLGAAVAVAGDMDGDGYCDIIAGAPQFDEGQSDTGRARVYRGSSSGLKAATVFDGVVPFENLGASVAAAGDVNGDGFADIAVGRRHYDSSPPEGPALVRLGKSNLIASSPGWTHEPDQADAAYGWSVASAGDVNGDGYCDVIVGALNYTNIETREGGVFVYHGSAHGLSPAPNWSAESNQAFAEFGYSAATAGDVNGDGYDDVIIGSPQYSNGEFAEGRAWLYLGSPTGLAVTPAWTAESNQFDGKMGRIVGTAGDVNADGYADVFIGSYSYTNGEVDEGLALVFHGCPSGLGDPGTPENADWRTEGNQTSAWYGRFGGSAGDVNGDGYGDVIVGAYRYSNGQDQEGAAFVYYGSPTGLSTTPAWIGESNQTNAAFGFSANTAGDVNGDGFSDVIIGAVNYFGGQFWEGAAYVYLGAASGLASAPSWMIEGNQIEARLGWSAGAAGDVNGDGFGDILVSSYLHDDDQVNEGRTFVYLGSASGPPATPAQVIDGHQSDAQFGFSSARAGDVNGDGYSDVIIGANSHDGGQQNEGRASLYFGNDRPGMGLVPRQRRVNSTAPIAHQGRSDITDAITLAAIGRTPFGRARVRLQWEIKPSGEPLNGTGTQESLAFVDTGIAGIPLTATPMNLACGTPYHWAIRLRFDPSSVPFAPHSPWMNLQAHSRQEAHVRTSQVPGDMNCDCIVNLNDVTALVSAMLDSSAHAAMHPLCGPGADMQPDGNLNGADITAFVALLLDP